MDPKEMGTQTTEVGSPARVTCKKSAPAHFHLVEKEYRKLTSKALGRS